MLTVRRFKVGQIYYILYFATNKDKVIYRELFVIQDATALHHQVVIEFCIFKDINVRAQFQNKKDKQYPNIKLWRNSYNNILNNLFKDLDNKSTESLKAAI